jgi:hypothetical protein
MAILRVLKQLLKPCFSSQDNSNERIAKTSAMETMTISQTSTIASEKTIKVIATPTVVETSTPLTQQALVIAAKHTYRLDRAFPVPEVHNGDEILIRNCAVGLNPIDWKSVDWNFCLPEFPWVCLGMSSSLYAKTNS